MKALIGVDTSGTYEPVVHLFGRLGFPSPDLTLINAVDLVFPYTSFAMPTSIEASSDVVDGLKEAGLQAVKEAAAIAKKYGIDAKQEVVSGPCVLTVLDRADQMVVDLIGVTSSRKGHLAALFTGSMSRSIVTSSKHPVLVAKGEVKADGPIEAVFATDHSPYAEMAIEKFLALAPKGISRIHVVTAYEISDKESELLHANLPALDGHLNQFIEEKLDEKCRALVGKLAQHGFDSDYTLSNGDPNKLINQVMAERKADLLIMGAQGHGFLDRLFLGSVSFHQLVAEPHSMLILRNS